MDAEDVKLNVEQLSAADTPNSDPVTVIDLEEEDSLFYSEKVAVRFISTYSSFGINLGIPPESILKHAKETFGKCANWNSNDLRYLFNGTIVEDNDTPQKLGLKDNDIIQVIAEDRFEASCDARRKEELSSPHCELLSVVDQSNSILVSVENQGGYVHRYRIKPTTNLKGVMEDFGKRSGNMHLRFTFDGERIQPGDTPEKILSSEDEGFEVEDFKIEAHLEATGGAR